jgi:hypothetical protein
MTIALAVTALAVAGRAGGKTARGPVAGSAAARSPTGVSFDASGWSTDFARHAVPLSTISSGGPGRDGIPPLDHPRFVSAADAAHFLTGREPVIAFAIAGQARAYPLQILLWHEIVNTPLQVSPPLERVETVTAGAETVVLPFDALRPHPASTITVGGLPAVVFFDPNVSSPLDARATRDSRAVGTAAAFDRRLDGKTLRFSSAGLGNRHRRADRHAVGHQRPRDRRAPATCAAAPPPRPAGVLVRGRGVRPAGAAGRALNGGGKYTGDWMLPRDRIGYRDRRADGSASLTRADGEESANPLALASGHTREHDARGKCTTHAGY